MNRQQIAAMIDHTLVRANATRADIDRLCEEAVRYGFAAVSINPVWTAYCAERLQGTPVRVNPVVGFPLGAIASYLKVEETKEATRNGANEIDMVINIGGLKSGYLSYVEREITDVVNAVKGIPVKVILETCYLTQNEKIHVCEISMQAGAAFVKTSTGFGPAGAVLDDVRLMRKIVGNTLGVKAAGGIRTVDQVRAFLAAGATRIGSSASVDFITHIPD